MLLSTSSFGGFDLDFRSPPLARGTEKYSIRKCPHCGYVSPSLAELIEDADNYIQSSWYKYCGSLDVADGDARKFIQYAILCEHVRNEDAAINAYVHAAWMCDDSGEKEDAIKIRQKAAALIMRQYQRRNLSGEAALRAADTLRRSRRFVDAAKVASAFTEVSDPELSAAFAFELSAAKQWDGDCYRFSEHGIEKSINVSSLDADRLIQKWLAEDDMGIDFFANEVLRSANQMAVKIARATAEKPGQERYNPLYIYGSSGIRKYLLQAMASHISQQHPDLRVIFTSGDRFVRETISAIASVSKEQFQEKYRRADVVLIDDISAICDTSVIFC